MPSKKNYEEISELAVKGLFGRFNHTLSLHEGSDVTIVTAPNGFGKTILLRILDSIFNKKFNFFWNLSFNEIQLQFRSGKSLHIYKQPRSRFEEEIETEKRTVYIKTLGFDSDDTIHELLMNLPSAELQYLERRFPVDRVAHNLWFDYRSESNYTTDEIIERYGDQLPEKLLKSLKLPDWLEIAVTSVRVNLVETQRLLALEDEEKMAARYKRARMRTSSVVEKDALDLAAKIGQVLQQYANESQKLDQSFPKRIIEFRTGEVGDEAQIRRQLEELTYKRSDLVSVGLIGKTISEPIKPSEIFADENIRRILSIYIDDTTTKLGIFDDTYDRIRLFKEILDEHFSFKKMEIDPVEGIRAIDDVTNRVIPLSALSSGEQHELVLIYELLFKVEEGSVILVDEPELSLHVAWQKRFISDIRKIQKLRKLKVIIATHSPQIINDNWDLVQELHA